MSFCKDIIKEKLEFTSYLFRCSKNGSKRKEVLSEICNDYREAYNFLSGNYELSFKPHNSIKELNRHLSLLNEDKELNNDLINELNEAIKRLSD